MRLKTPAKTGLRRALCGAAGLFMVALAGMPGSARAACSDPVGYAGDQIYNSTHSVMQYCNAADQWIPMWGLSSGVAATGAAGFDPHTANCTAANTGPFAKVTNTPITNNPYAIWGKDDHLFVPVYSQDAVRAYSFDGTTFSNIGNYNAPAAGNPADITGDDNYIYVADRTAGVIALEHNGSSFTYKNIYDTEGTALGVWSDGTYIYVADGTTGTNNLYALTFNGTTFSVAGTYNTTDSTGDIWGDGTYIYVADGANGIHAFTFNGTTFNLINTYNTPGTASGVWGDGTHIFVADAAGGVHALTFNGTAFSLVDTYGAANGGEVWSDGVNVYASSTVGVVALSWDGSNFSLIDEYDSPNQVTGIWGDGTYIYITDTDPGANGGLIALSGFTCTAADTGGGGSGKLFSTDLYTGNNATQDITNDIDLSVGGAVWIKPRENVADNEHSIFDTIRGANMLLEPNRNDQEVDSSPSLTAFNNDGFSIANTGSKKINTNGDNYVAWSFKEAPGFFDIVTYTGDGNATRAINHALGAEPGFILVKEKDEGSDWVAWHRSYPSNYFIFNTNNAINAISVEPFGSTGHSTAAFNVTNQVFGTSDSLNESGREYIAYVFAHGDYMQCGTYTGNGSSNGPVVNLGWEPEWLMIKDVNSTGNNSEWTFIDSKRPYALFLNNSAEGSMAVNWAADWVQPTGFEVADSASVVNYNGDTFAYCAIKKNAGLSGGGGGGGGSGASSPEDRCNDADGEFIGNACWFLGEAGDSCADACDSVFGIYDAATLSYGGSTGSNANCQSVLDALSAPGTGTPTTQANAYGCHVNGTTRRRGTSATTDVSFNATVRRACACKVGGDDLGDHLATEAINMNSNRIVNLGIPTANTDIATKGYVDSKTGASETDPQIGALTANKWCAVAGTAIVCNQDAPGGGAMQEPQTVVATFQKPQGTAGGTPGAAGSWHYYPLNNLKQNSVGAFLENYGLRLPAGTYYIDAAVNFTASGQTKLQLSAGGVTLINGVSAAHGTAVLEDGQTYLRGIVVLMSETTVYLQYRLTDVLATNGLGLPQNQGTEVYGTLYVEKMD